MDNILSSMDKITKKPDPVKNGDNSKPDKKETTAAAVATTEDKDQTEQKRKEREEEKARQMEKRRKELADSKVEVDRPQLDDLTSDDWGSSARSEASTQPRNAFKATISTALDDDNSDEELPEPVSAIDDPVSSKPIPMSPKSIVRKELPQPKQSDDVSRHVAHPSSEAAQIEPEDYADDYQDDYDAGYDDYDNNSVEDLNVMDKVDDSLKQSGVRNAELSDQGGHISKKDSNKEKEVNRRELSRTPSPFLRTNRYYPEFYAKKERMKSAAAATAKRVAAAAMPATTVPVAVKSVPVPAPSGVPAPVPAPLTVLPPQPVPPPDPLKNVKFPSDIDQRIARHFREKRSREEQRRNKRKTSDSIDGPGSRGSESDSKIGKSLNDFNIDTNDSFMSSHPHTFGESGNRRDLGSRLSGAGLGIFIQKVISSLKGKSKLCPPIRPVPPVPPPNQALPPPPPFSIPVPPPTTNGIQNSELEPGELPDSPKMLGEDDCDAEEDDNSTINVQEADLDESMILEIVGELDDTLEEEEKLSKAKEKLAKHLLKKKSATTAGSVSSSVNMDRRQSVRKMMMMQLPTNNDNQTSEIIKNIGLPPPPPPPECAAGPLPSFPRPLQVGPPPTMPLHTGPPATRHLHTGPPPTRPLQTGPPPTRPLQTGPPQSRPPQSPSNSPLLPLGQQEFFDSQDSEHSSFVTQWGCDDGYQGRGQYYEESERQVGQHEDYNSAISKLRAANRNPTSMSSALEKLRSMKRRTLIDSPFGEPFPKRGRLEPNLEPPSMSSVVDDFLNDDRPVTNPLFAARNSFQQRNTLYGNGPSRDVGDVKRGFDRATEQDRQNFEMNSALWSKSRLDDFGSGGHIRNPAFFDDRQQAGGVDAANQRNALDQKPYGGGERFNGGGLDNPAFHAASQDGFRRNGQLNLNQPQTPQRLMDITVSPFRKMAEDSSLHISSQQDVFGGQDGPQSFNRPVTKPPSLMDQKFDSTINDSLCDLSIALVEKEYLERFAFNWKKLIDNDFPPILDNFLASLDNKKKELNGGKETEDLGTTFNDMRLNMRVLSPTGGELDVFSSSIIDGVLQFKCEICGITVLGKRNIESHMLGKKHKAKLDDFKVVGMYFYFFTCASSLREILSLTHWLTH